MRLQVITSFPDIILFSYVKTCESMFFIFFFFNVVRDNDPLLNYVKLPDEYM